MAGLFDGAFGGGFGILPDWLMFNPQAMSQMPNAMDGPAGNFADRWSGTSAMPRMQSVESSPLSISEMLGGGRMAYSGEPARPAMNPFNSQDSGTGQQAPVPQAMPAQAPQQSAGPGFGDRMLAGLLGFGNSEAPIPAIANLIGGLATGQRTDPTAMKLAQQRQSGDIQEYEYAKNQGFPGTFENWMSAKRLAGAPKAGLTPIVDGDGAVWQLTSDGQLIKPKGSENFKINKGFDKIDLGTEWGVVSKVTGQIVGKYPKDIQGREAAEKRGQAQGEAQAGLPTAAANAERMLRQINEVQSHPAREMGTGAVMGRVPAVGGQQADFVERVDQLKGQAFLQAFQTLKGAGAITEVEGAKATTAIARLSRIKDKTELDSALNDLKEVIETGMKVARQKAGQQPAEAPASDPKAALKKKYGLQ